MTAYEILGVPEGASNREIARAFRVAALRHHPDRGGDPDMLRLACRAHALVGEPEARAAYDRRLREKRERRGRPAGGEARRVDVDRVVEVVRAGIRIWEALKGR